MPSFSIALSGLSADSAALDTIGNNLANLNTTAFKTQSTTFSDLFYQQIGSSGSGNPLQMGVGTKVQGTSSDFSQGSIATTNNSTDMAVDGNGFFVVNTGGVQELTRSGNFTLDSNGGLTTADGQQVMGYQAKGGAISSGSPLTALSLPVSAVESANPTQNFTLGASLNATATVGTTFPASLTMYDSLGVSHNATATFTKTATNQWSYSIALPAGDYTGTPVNNTGTLTFNSAGTLTSPTGSIAGIKFPGMADGASDLSFNWNLNDASGNPTISQTAAASAVSTSSQDGYASGLYQSFTVDTTGTLSAQFSNGNTQVIGQLALASVSNQQGLTRLGNNSYGTTQTSGNANIGVAGSSGNGTIEDDALEASNVDISTEFANLIVAQRAFEANSKTVTTFDTVTQDTINLIR